MEKTALTEEQLAEWRAGEARRNEYWDKRVQALIDDTDQVLTPQQMQEIRDYWSQWKETVNPAWAAFYIKGNGRFDPCYIPNNIYFGRISRALNRRDYLVNPLLQDKNYLDMIFPDLLRPETLVRNVYGQFLDKDYRPICAEDAAKLLLQQEEFVIKPSIETKQASNVEFYSANCRTIEDILQLFRERGKDFIVQKVLTQHPDLAALNPDSINTIRILSLLWKGEVIILGSIVRVGTAGVRVDNLVRSHGVSCGIGQDGTFLPTAYDKLGHPCTQLPNGIRFAHYRIPGYARAVEMVKANHARLAHFKLIGWDITVTPQGDPVLIEANLDTPAISFHQFATGPVFGSGDLLREILAFTYEQYPMY